MSNSPKSAIVLAAGVCYTSGVPGTRLITATDDDMADAVREAVALLAAGEVVALPTETVYGLAADAFNAAAVAKLFEVKERPAFDPLIVHVAARRELEHVAELPEAIAPVVRRLLEAFWPGPFTVVLPKKPSVPDIVTSGLPTVAVRHSANPVIRAVGKALGRPLAAPSANRFGRISPTSASAVLTELGGRIPLVIDGGACREGLESTIVAVEAAPKRPLLRVLRAGPVTREDLRPFGKVVMGRRVTDRPEAPGGLESHYAPSTPLMVVERPADFRPEPGKRYGLLSYRGADKRGWLGAHPWAAVETLSPGSGKLSEAAVRLFFALRRLDQAGLDAIVAEPVSEVGLGVAIMDRLRRAAAGGCSGQHDGPATP